MKSQQPQTSMTPLGPEYTEQFVTLVQQLMRQREGPEYAEQFVALVQQLMPCLVAEKENLPLKKISRSMALAVVSLALMIPLVYIVLLQGSMSHWGMVAQLIGIGVIGGVMVLINVTFSILLLVVKS